MVPPCLSLPTGVGVAEGSLDAGDIYGLLDGGVTGQGKVSSRLGEHGRRHVHVHRVGTETMLPGVRSAARRVHPGDT